MNIYKPQFHSCLSAVHIYDFHIFIFMLFTIIGYMTNSQLPIYPCGLIAQWIEHCTSIARSWVRVPFKPECFFRLLFQLLKEVENEWKKQWKGKTFFSHGTNHSRGVLILVKDQLDFKLQSLKVDSQGRYVLLEALIQDSPFALLNIHVPNKCAEQCDFFNKFQRSLKARSHSRILLLLSVETLI